MTGITERYEHCDFNTFLTNNFNRSHYNTCKNLNGKSITLLGNCGTGKTHLAISILKNFPMQQKSEEKIKELERDIKFRLNVIDLHKEKTPEEIQYKNELEYFYHSGSYKFRPARCLFIPIVEMFLELNEASYNSGEQSKLALLDQYNSFDCICLDDLGAEKLTEASRQNLYCIIDRRYREMKPLIVTSNFLIEEINDVEPRIASRLQEMGEILIFEGDDFRIEGK